MYVLCCEDLAEYIITRNQRSLERNVEDEGSVQIDPLFMKVGPPRLEALDRGTSSALITALPQEIMDEAAGYLSTDDKFAFALASRCTFNAGRNAIVRALAEGAGSWAGKKVFCVAMELSEYEGPDKPMSFETDEKDTQYVQINHLACVEWKFPRNLVKELKSLPGPWKSQILRLAVRDMAVIFHEPNKKWIWRDLANRTYIRPKEFGLQQGVIRGAKVERFPMSELFPAMIQIGANDAQWKLYHIFGVCRLETFLHLDIVDDIEENLGDSMHDGEGTQADGYRNVSNEVIKAITIVWERFRPWLCHLHRSCALTRSEETANRAADDCMRHIGLFLDHFVRWNDDFGRWLLLPNHTAFDELQEVSSDDEVENLIDQILGQLSQDIGH